MTTEETAPTQPKPAPRPIKPPQWWQDLYTDGAGHCFTDADEGL